MDEEDSYYISQLKDVYNSCDTTGTGFLDLEELIQLCRKLHLDKQLPALLQTLLGDDLNARVTFEEFKEGLVTVLSSKANGDLGSKEAGSSQAAAVCAVPPKYVSGSKRYGRWSQPEWRASGAEATCGPEQQARAGLKGQLCHAASLESVESLKSDEEAESPREPQEELFEAQGQLQTWGSEVFGSIQKSCSSSCASPESRIQGIWEQLGVGSRGHLDEQELAVVCHSIGLLGLAEEELKDLFHKLDQDGDGRVSLAEFQLGLCHHKPMLLPESPLLKPWSHSQGQVPEESGCHTATTTSSLASVSCGLRLFSSIDDGSGFALPEQVIATWAQEGIRSGREILQSLDFSLEEKVDLLELTWALDNELLTVDSVIQQAALACYRQELSYLQEQVEQLARERDKARQDLERAERRSLELAREMDDGHTALEQLTERRIQCLEQDYQGRLSLLRAEVAAEREQVWEQACRQHAALEQDLGLLRAEESRLRHRLGLAAKLEPQAMELRGQEERFEAVLKEYELKCRDLQDQNDELQAKLERLRMWPPGNGSQQCPAGEPRHHSAGMFSNNSRSVSLETEIMVEEMREHCQELRTQLEAKVNAYEGEIKAMKNSFEKERMELEQVRQREVAALEAQRADLEALCAKSQEVILGLREQLQEAAGSPKSVRAGPTSCCAQALCDLTQWLELRTQRQYQGELRQIRQEAAAELSWMLSRLEAQHDTCYKSLVPRHQCEKDWLRQVLLQREAEMHVRCQEQQQRLQAALGKEQVQMCRCFALERKRLEHAHCEQLEHLVQEAEVLQALLRGGAAATIGREWKGAPSHSSLCPGTPGGPEKLVGDWPGQPCCVDAVFQQPPESLNHEQNCWGLLDLEEVVSDPCEKGSLRWPPGQSEGPDSEKQAPSARATVSPSQPDVREQPSQGVTGNDALQTWLQHHPGPLLLHPELPNQTGETEAEIVERETGMKTKLLQLEDIVQAFEREADLRESDRVELQRLSAANSLLKSDLERIQQELGAAEHMSNQQRREIEVLKRDKEKACSEMDELSIQNQKYKNEVLQLNCRVLQLEGVASAHQAQNEENLATAQLLTQRLQEASRQEEQQEEEPRDTMEGQAGEMEQLLQKLDWLEKSARSGLLLKELYVENAQLTKALQVAEQKQWGAEKQNRILEEKVHALGTLISKLAPASLSV
ncbi:ninein-like protein isoform X3 [Cavia porcellus]|uniref:ninein-like protein isoform X3 n=1 Tax=Cavia porcellus TaxID=10141 RepID=UPI002FE20E5A